MKIRCDECRESAAEFAVGAIDHRLVCESCLDHGDRRRIWNLEPRQRIDGTTDVDPYAFAVSALGL